MKFLTSIIFAAGLLSIPLSASVCPSTSNTNTDCAFLLTIGTGGAVTGAAVAGANPYDGTEDALVGVINNSGAAFSGSVHLSSTVDLFGFEADGICTFTSAAYCSTAATGYEGPISTFSGISADKLSGDVVITGLAAGATTYFSLEGSPAAIGGGGGITVGGGSATPEPATFALLGAGLGGLALLRRKRKLSV